MTPSQPPPFQGEEQQVPFTPSPKLGEGWGGVKMPLASFTFADGIGRIENFSFESHGFFSAGRVQKNGLNT